MDVMLLEALSWCNVEVSCDLADLQKPSNVAPLVNLISQLVRPTLIHTLVNTLNKFANSLASFPATHVVYLWVVEGPPLASVCLPDLLTGIATGSLRSLSPKTANGTQNSNNNYIDGNWSQIFQVCYHWESQ